MALRSFCYRRKIGLTFHALVRILHSNSSGESGRRRGCFSQTAFTRRHGEATRRGYLFSASFGATCSSQGRPNPAGGDEWHRRGGGLFSRPQPTRELGREWSLVRDGRQHRSFEGTPGGPLLFWYDP